MSTRLDRTDRFWNRIAEQYAAKPVPDEGVYERKLAMTRGYLHPQAMVLELGCGTGSTAIRLAPHLQHIKAIDVSSRMVGIARKKATAAGIGNVEFETASVRQVRLPASSLDVVLAHSVLHLLDDWREAIANVHDMLRPGGIFVSSTVCLSDHFPLLRWITPLGTGLGALPRLAFFGRAEFERTIREVGFDIEHTWQPAPKRGLFLIARKLA